MTDDLEYRCLNAAWCAESTEFDVEYPNNYMSFDMWDNFFCKYIKDRNENYNFTGSAIVHSIRIKIYHFSHGYIIAFFSY